APPPVARAPPGPPQPFPAEDLLLGDEARPAEELGAAERGVVQRALARARGNVSAAARTLGVSRATLHRKLARFGLDRGR
ncbi:MAG: helix-turn-helix domain-containing protein, partial [Bosea sp. (in: a-proteobacteria)]